MANLSLKHIYKVYPNGAKAVNDFNMQIDDKEFIVFVGPSGCGKSTTLRMIAGLEPITAGELKIGDVVVNGMEPKDRDIAMVFQNYALYPHMTVYKNIAFGLNLKKMPKDEIDRRVHEAAKALDLEHLLNRKPKALSGGQRQRVALGRAMVRDPAVFLLDEPLSNLDAKLRIDMRSELKRLHLEMGTTIIYVTHDQEEAMAIADKIAILDNGRIQQYDTPEHLYHYPANLFVAKFMGNPPMNFVDARLDAGGTCVCGDGFELALEAKDRAGGRKYAGRDVKIGVRSHLMSVETERRPQSMQMKLQIVENLGKELLVSGMVGNSFVRVTVPEDHERFVAYKRLAAGRNPYVWLQITGIYNIFEAESGVNIGLEQ